MGIDLGISIADAGELEELAGRIDGRAEEVREKCRTFRNAVAGVAWQSDGADDYRRQCADLLAKLERNAQSLEDAADDLRKHAHAVRERVELLKELAEQAKEMAEAAKDALQDGAGAIKDGAGKLAEGVKSLGGLL